VDSVTVEVTGPGARVLSRADGFLARSAEQGEWWDILLGIPANAPVKDLSLSLHVTAGQRSCLFLQPLSVTHRAFFSERIPFNKELTKLITVPDSRKDSEYQVLLHVLRTPHSDAQYETGALLVPLPSARRTSNYGDRREYLLANDESDASIHQGVDLAAPTGTAVPASGRGRVVFAGLRIMTGNSVIIEHMPGLFSLYFHMSMISVAVGDVVEKGQPIGQVGMTGLATGPHLHWQVDAFTTAVDPDALASRPLLDTEPDF
jgi:murein DD-endopeptidase MepM/ murein hydrolase activator NlpD